MSKGSMTNYYQNNKERLKKKAPERYQSLFKVKKEKKQKYGCQSYKDRTKDEKQKAC